MSGKWLTIEQAAHELDVSSSTIRRRIKQGDIESKLEKGKRMVLVPDNAPTIGTVGALEYLRKQNEQLTELVLRLQQESQQSKERSDTIILQLTQQSRLAIEAKKESIWDRWFKKRGQR